MATKQVKKLTKKKSSTKKMKKFYLMYLSEVGMNKIYDTIYSTIYGINRLNYSYPDGTPSPRFIRESKRMAKICYNEVLDILKDSNETI